MEIIIPLPSIDNLKDRTYSGFKGYLKQLELAVHHAQKSVEQFEKDGVELTEDSFIEFSHPYFSGHEKIHETNIDDFVSNYYDEFQNVQLRIVIE